MTTPEKIKIDETEYVRADRVPHVAPNGNRCVVVVDRGWIFAGDLTEENGRIKLTRAVHVFRWESIGFDGMLAKPDSEKVTLKKLRHDVDIPSEAEIFRVPVSNNWGML